MRYIKKHWLYILLLVALFTSFTFPAVANMPVIQPVASGDSLWEVDGTETQLIDADEIDMQTKKIINVVDPGSDQDAATKKYTDDAIDTDIATHAALTATHGVAEIAGIADIVTHSDLTTGIHGVTGTVLGTEDVDDTPVNGATTDPVSSNWAYDHNVADTGVHGAGTDYLVNSGQSIVPETVTLSEIDSDGLRSMAHNVLQFVQNNIWTFSGNEYAAYIDSSGNVMAAKRSMPAGAWSTQDTGVNADTTDLHNGAFLGIDPDGYIHIFYDLHADTINGHYIVSDSAEDISAWSGVAQMTGSNENLVTYVNCFTDGNYLFCTYRNGYAGDGEIYLNKYDHGTTTWSAVAAPLINASAAERSPYVSEVAVDSNGYFHIAWCWRENLDAGGWVNKNICYAKSLDSGATWKESDGTGYSLPITFAASEVVDELGEGDGLYNNPRIQMDTDDIPHIVYSKADDFGFINYFHAWLDTGSWDINQVSSFVDTQESSVPWNSFGDFSMPNGIARPSVVTSGTEAIVLFTYPIMVGQVYAAVADDPYTSWTFHKLGDEVWGVQTEINFDKAYWDSNSVLVLLISAPDLQAGSTPVYSLATTPSAWQYGFPFSLILQDVAIAKGAQDLLRIWGAGTKISGYLVGDQTIPNNDWTKVQFNTENYDLLNEFDGTVISGTAENIAGAFLKDTGAFTEGESEYLGRTLWNTTDDTYTTVTGKVDDDTLSLTADIVDNGETYELYFSRFTAKNTGTYIFSIKIAYEANAVGVRCAKMYLNGAGLVANLVNPLNSGSSNCILTWVQFLVVDDYIELYARQTSGGALDVLANDSSYTQFTIIRL